VQKVLYSSDNLLWTFIQDLMTDARQFSETSIWQALSGEAAFIGRDSGIPRADHHMCRLSNLRKLWFEVYTGDALDGIGGGLP
jgi:hypothetical protein